MSTQNDTKKEVVTFTIDDVSVTVPKGTTVYEAAKQLDITIPIFCYQDRMPPFGACRVCMVEVEKMAKPQTSCTLVATEGMVVRTQSNQAVKAREQILEFLLINHPLDCPICDKGGECPLQDQAYDHGPGLSRFFEDKRRFKKPIPKSPVLMLDRERCIVCARCTRFGDIVAGDHALELIDRGYKSEVGTPHGENAESKFIGNTIMICPVGALTSQVYRFRARPWDNDSTDSTCTLCPVGCSMVLDARDGEIMRTRTKENLEVNDIWMCDKGWFGYEFSSSTERLSKPLVRRNGKLVEATWEEALNLIAAKIKEVIPGGKIGALGGNPLTVEENYLFQSLMRKGAQTDNLDHNVGCVQFPSTGMNMSIGDCEKLSHAYLLGLDLTEEFPVIWLRLKQGINRGAKVKFMGYYAPEISTHLEETILHSPGQELEQLKQHLQEIIHQSKEGQKCALFVGSQYLNSGNSAAILSEIQKAKELAPNLTINLMQGSGNSYGASFAGMHPKINGLNALQMIQTSAKSSWDFLYVAGANPSVKYPSKLWQQARKNLSFLVVQDVFLTETAQQADVVLPTLCYVEKGGSFINIEGRVQRLLPGKQNPLELLSDGEIFTKLAEKLGVTIAIDPELLEKLQLSHVSLNNHRKQQAETINQNKGSQGSLLATFAKVLFDQGTRMNHNEHVKKMVKEPRVRMSEEDASKRNLKNGDRISVKSSYGEINGIAAIDKGVAEKVVVLPLGFKDLPVHELGENLWNGMAVEVTKLS